MLRKYHHSSYTGRDSSLSQTLFIDVPPDQFLVSLPHMAGSKFKSELRDPSLPVISCFAVILSPHTNVNKGSAIGV